jgi:hypothetical protein
MKAIDKGHGGVLVVSANTTKFPLIPRVCSKRSLLEARICSDCTCSNSGIPHKSEFYAYSYHGGYPAFGGYTAAW